METKMTLGNIPASCKAVLFPEKQMNFVSATKKFWMGGKRRKHLKNGEMFP
jgi:hypothetical protein